MTCPKSPRSRTGVIVLMCGIYQRVGSPGRPGGRPAPTLSPARRRLPAVPGRRPAGSQPGGLGLAGPAAGALAALPTPSPRGEGLAWGVGGTASDVCEEAEAVSPEASRLSPRLFSDF